MTTTTRRHLGTVDGIAPPAGVALLPARRSEDRDRQRPRVLVYVEGDVVDVITVGDVRLDGTAAAELAGLLRLAAAQAGR